MVTPASPVPVGILGLGFLGKILAAELRSVSESWGTWHETPPLEPLIPVFHFDWADENFWTALPKTPATLVLTIPPLLKNLEAENERLQIWGTWMRQNRPQLKRLIYISTTNCCGIHEAFHAFGTISRYRLEIHFEEPQRIVS